MSRGEPRMDFADRIRELAARILQGLGSGSDDRPLWLTGHSLGGAVAVLTASRLEKRVQGVYVYGAPRVGDADFGGEIDERIVCFVQGRDPVANVPPLRFRSVPVPHLIDQSPLLYVRHFQGDL
ncbi:MAG: alpha/beta fold hydrolase [Thermoanaerobaculia bacterium]